MKVKKIPMRKCIACGENKPKKDLLRIVNNKEEGILVDNTGKKNGRGAYICKNIDCLKLAKKANKINHALKAEVNEEIYKEIADYVTNSK